MRRGLSTEGNLRFKSDWASLTVGSKFTVFALFYFVFEGTFPSTSPRGAYIWRGDLTGFFFVCSRFGGRIFGGAYFRNFKVVSKVIIIACDHLVVSKMPKKRRKNEENRLFSQNHRNQDSDNLGKCPWDSTATFRLFCHFWVPS